MQGMYELQKCLLSKGFPTAGVALGASTTQSYDLMCMVPNRSLLKTVIPGWLWRGMTADGGKQKIPICKLEILVFKKDSYDLHALILSWNAGEIPVKKEVRLRTEKLGQS